MFQVVTAPSGTPMSLADAKKHLRIDDDITDDDSYVERMINAVWKFIENRTGIVLLDTKLALYLDTWPDSALIYLKKKPITAISKVEYYATDTATAYTELATTEYQTDVISAPARVYLEDAPTLGDKLNAVKVTFNVGYANSAAIPENIIKAMEILMGHLYENRQEEITGRTISYLKKGFEYLLSNDEMITA